MVRWLALRLLVLAAVVGLARQVAYGLAPSRPLSERFAGEAGGPAAVWVALAALAMLVFASLLGVWLVRMGIRERRAVELAAWANATPRFGVRALLADATGLSVAGLALFAIGESWLHARAGLAMSPVACLTAPVHRNGIVIVAALGVFAALVLALVRFAVAGLRRRVAHLLVNRPKARAAGALPRPATVLVRRAALCCSLRQRPPPPLPVR
jgi:hypothetical protein